MLHCAAGAWGVGSPASAGIVPAVSVSGEVELGFPRERGDSPVSHIGRCAAASVPPRARG